MTNKLFEASVQVAIATLYVLLLLLMPAALLAFVGWPGPTEVPTIETVRLVISGNEKVPELFILKSLAVFGWIIWAQLIYSTIAEVRAARLGLLAQRSAFIPGFQKFVAGAVLAITLLVNGLRPAGASLVINPPSASQPFEAVDLNAQPEAAADTTSELTNTYTTKPGDSWWKLAKGHLGDGARFCEIRDLNIGRTFDGVTVTATSDYLGTGWELRMPSDFGNTDGKPSNHETTDSKTSNSKTNNSTTVRAGESVSKIAAKHGFDFRKLLDINILANPDLIHPGDELLLPDSPTDTSATSQVSPGAESPQLGFSESETETSNRGVDDSTATLGPPSPEPARNPRLTAADNVDSSSEALPRVAALESSEVTDQTAGGSTDARSLVGTLLVAAGILASGLYGVRRRRLQKSLRELNFEAVDYPESPDYTGSERFRLNDNPATPLAADKPALRGLTPSRQAHRRDSGQQLTNRIAAAASYQDADFLEVILQLVGQRMGQSSSDPGVVAAIIGNNAAEIVFAREPGFEPGPIFDKTPRPGWRAMRPDSLDNLKQLASFSPVPCPAMVSLGSINSASSVAVNLEEIGGLNLVGNDKNIRSVMFSLVVELATTRIADTLKIVAIGFGSSLPEFDRLETYDTVPDNLQPASVISNPAMQRLLEVDPLEPIIAISPDPQMAQRLAVPGVIPITANSEELGLWNYIVSERTAACPKLGLANIDRASISDEGIRQYLAPLPLAPLPLAEKDFPGPASANEAPSSNCARPEDLITLAPIQIAATTTGPVGNSLLKSVQLFDGAEVPRSVPGQTSELRAPEQSTKSSVSNGRPRDKFAPASPADLGFDYMVSVLGPIRCAGVGLFDASKPWKLRKVPELLTLLATSELGRTSDSLKELLWPGEDPAKCGRRLNNVVSELRRSVVGEERLPKVTAGSSLYRVHNVGTDLALLEENLRRAKEANSEQLAMKYLSAALGLVDGVPFDLTGTPTGEYGWAEPIEYATTVKVISAAQRLATWLLSAGQPAEAAEAAERGLLVSADNYVLLDLFGKASLAESNNDRCLKALLAIRAAQHQFDALPGETEVTLPESLLRAEAALQTRVETLSGSEKPALHLHT